MGAGGDAVGAEGHAVGAGGDALGAGGDAVGAGGDAQPSLPGETSTTLGAEASGGAGERAGERGGKEHGEGEGVGEEEEEEEGEGEGWEEEGESRVVECVTCRARLAREAAEIRRVEKIRRQWDRLRHKMSWLRLRLRVWLLRRIMWGLTRSQLQAELSGTPTPGCREETALKATREDPRYAVRVVNSLAGISKGDRQSRRGHHRHDAATLQAYDWGLAALTQCYYPGPGQLAAVGGFPLPEWERLRLKKLKQEAPPPLAHEAAASLFQNQDSAW